MGVRPPLPAPTESIGLSKIGEVQERLSRAAARPCTGNLANVRQSAELRKQLPDPGLAGCVGEQVAGESIQKTRFLEKRSESWLKTQAHLQEPEPFAQATKTTAGQQAFFETKFTDLKVIRNAVVPDLWRYVKFDDYPDVRVRVDFLDGSKLRGLNSLVSRIHDPLAS